ncbi:hypothetical protein Aple_010580 [Acrocarpospora pleiomorpha]|uniref:Uncharacterized protein n=1 Tax=Acrocarpospora pleiomorpha TaxID=90975 RepID=A0A5M3XGR9_9ACTN|nr:hypothetical protein [Acrocarpospora pleiomorpha]GES18163.1 hypothetical protein Aple_010580 [Acrocarpospora pleiomorpha]
MIELDASSPALATSSSDPITSDSFAPPAGTLLAACLSIRDSTDTAQSVTDSAGLTWTQRVTRLSAQGGPAGQVGIWTAPCPIGVPAGMTVSAAVASVVTPMGLKVYVWRGVDLANPVGATGGSGTNVSENNNFTFQAYLNTVRGSRGIAACHDWNNLGLPSSTDEESAAVISGAQAVCHIIKANNTDADPGAQVTFNVDAAGSGAPFTKLCWAELLPAIARPPYGRTHLQAAQRASAW